MLKLYFLLIRYFEEKPILSSYMFFLYAYILFKSYRVYLVISFLSIISSQNYCTHFILFTLLLFFSYFPFYCIYYSLNSFPNHHPFPLCHFTIVLIFNTLVFQRYPNFPKITKPFYQIFIKQRYIPSCTHPSKHIPMSYL